MTHLATIISRPTQTGEHYEFNCLFDERHTAFAVCLCRTKSQPHELQIGNKVILHQSENVEKSATTPNLFWIDRIEKR